MSAFIEEHCVFPFDGKEYESGGAYLLPDKNGLLGGVLYMFQVESPFVFRGGLEGGVYEIGTWHGDKKVPCHVSRSWRNNMGDRRRAISFEWEGHSMYGVWSCSAQDCVRVRERRHK